MTAEYVGVKRVTAWPQKKDGKPGYAVKYSDGYISWSPADVFERSYFQLADDSGQTISEYDVNRFIQKLEVGKHGDRTTMAHAILANGFLEFAASSCVTPERYDHDMGAAICLEKIKDKAWELLGFVLQWANNGIVPEDKSEV